MRAAQTWELPHHPAATTFHFEEEIEKWRSRRTTPLTTRRGRIIATVRRRERERWSLEGVAGVWAAVVDSAPLPSHPQGPPLNPAPLPRAGIKRPKPQRYRNTRGMDPKFLRNQRYAKKGTDAAREAK